jgi:hypothetical protein
LNLLRYLKRNNDRQIGIRSMGWRLPMPPPAGEEEGGGRMLRLTMCLPAAQFVGYITHGVGRDWPTAGRLELRTAAASAVLGGG